MAVYLVVGGAGFIGSNLVEALLRQGDTARVLDDFSTGRRENLAQAEDWAAAGRGSYELIEGDIRDRETCRKAMDGAHFVLHQAAIPSVQRSVKDPITTNAVNVIGTLNLLESAREAKIERFVLASSSSLYGESETLPKVESMPCEPISPYGLQKLAAEKYCLLYHRLYGLPTVALRYFNVFGPRQDPHSQYSAVIPLFITAAKAGRGPTIFGDGLQTRDFTFIRNVVQANLRSCQAGAEALGKPYNIGCGERYSLLEVLRRIGMRVGREVVAEHAPPRPGDIRHSLAAIDQARSLLGYDPVDDLDRGLDQTLEAY